MTESLSLGKTWEVTESNLRLKRFPCSSCSARTRRLRAGSGDGHRLCCRRSHSPPWREPSSRLGELRASFKSLPGAKERGSQSKCYILRCMRHQRRDNTSISNCMAPVEHFHSCCRRDGALSESYCLSWIQDLPARPEPPTPAPQEPCLWGRREMCPRVKEGWERRGWDWVAGWGRTLLSVDFSDNTFWT